MTNGGESPQRASPGGTARREASETGSRGSANPAKLQVDTAGFEPVLSAGRGRPPSRGTFYPKRHLDGNWLLIRDGDTGWAELGREVHALITPDSVGLDPMSRRRDPPGRGTGRNPSQMQMRLMLMGSSSGQSDQRVLASPFSCRTEEGVLLVSPVVLFP